MSASRRGGLTLRQRLAILLGISAGVLTIASVILFSALATLATQRKAVVADIHPAALAARDLRTALVDQETGVRGFVITGDPDFLTPYDRGQTAELVAKAALEPLAARDPEIGAAFERFRLAADAWQSTFAVPSVEQTIAGDPSAESDAVQVQGRGMFEEVRASIDELELELDSKRTDAVDALNQAAARVWTVTICVLIGFVALGVVIAVALNRSVTGPIVQLANEVRGIAEGDLSRTVAVEGIPEIEGLAEDIDAMRLQILGEIERLNQVNLAVGAQAVELARSNADLEQFAYVASHDLQEPLRKIAGFCQLLERRYKGQLDDRADEYIAFAVDGAKRMQDLINDLLSFSRVGRSTDGFEPLDLSAVIAESLDNLRSAIDESGAEIEVTVGELPTVMGDRRLLVALFQNLIGNAVKFRGEEHPIVQIGAGVEGDSFVVAVADNGIGIDEEYAQQIFTIFQRLHNRTDYEGTGIGLALAKKIVEFHGGSIWLDATVTGGATFRFRLPVGSRSDGGARLGADAPLVSVPSTAEEASSR